MKKILLIILSLLFSATLYSQKCYEIFRNEGMKEFQQANYEKAVANFTVANDCEDKPRQNDILERINNANAAWELTQRAESVFIEKRYEVAQYLFKSILKLNSLDSNATAKLILCEERIKCFHENYIFGDQAMQKSDYKTAISLFEAAASCEVQPDVNDAVIKVQKAQTCESLRKEADSLFQKGKIGKAIKIYEEVLFLNPYDTTSRKVLENTPDKFERIITDVPTKNTMICANFLWRNTGFLERNGFTFSNAHIGATFIKYGKWGAYANFALGFSEYTGTTAYESYRYYSAESNTLLYTRSTYGFTAEKLHYEIINGELLEENEIEDWLSFHFTIGGVRQLNFEQERLAKFYLLAGLGIANWAQIEYDYEYSARSLRELPNTETFYVNQNNIFQEIEVNQYYVNNAENSFSIDNYTSLAIELMLMMRVYRYSFLFGTSYVPTFDGFASAVNQTINFGIGYSF